MEQALIEWLRERLTEHPLQTVPFGDDAAVLGGIGPATSNASGLVVTTDLISDGVDFRLGEVEPRRIGRKALAVNLSDLAAMAAEPLGALVSIALPTGFPLGGSQLELATALYEGMLPLAEQFDCPLLGGDTNMHDGPLVISITALGTATLRGPLIRSGGRPGDRLLVTGTLGGSLAGHHLDFTPRIREALLLHQTATLHAGMDISDGLALDASRLAGESGCGAVIEIAQLPLSDAAQELEHPIQHGLGDGEDFELLLAVPPDAARRLIAEQPLECGLSDIGELVAERGLWERDGAGEIAPLEPTGWLHG